MLTGTAACPILFKAENNHWKGGVVVDVEPVMSTNKLLNGKIADIANPNKAAITGGCRKCPNIDFIDFNIIIIIVKQDDVGGGVTAASTSVICDADDCCCC